MVVQHFQVRLPVRRHLDLDASIGLSLALLLLLGKRSEVFVVFALEVGRRRGIRDQESGIRNQVKGISRSGSDFFGSRTDFSEVGTSI